MPTSEDKIKLDAMTKQLQGAQTTLNQMATAQSTPVISSESLTPQSTFALTPPKPSTQTDGTLAFLNQQSTQYAKDLDAKAKEAEKPLSDFQSQITSLLQEPGKTELTSQAYDKSGVNTAETELKDINNQILSEQVALQRRLEAMEKNPQGLFGGALQDEMQRVKDESLKRQADLSVVQLSKQGRFDSAKTIADRAVAAFTEARQNKLDALQFMYSENKDLFTKAEQRAFEVSQKQREGELDFERDKLKAEYNSQLQLEEMEYQQKLKQADPMYQAQLAMIPLERAYKTAQINAIGWDNLQKEAELADKANGFLSEKDIKNIDTSPQGKQLVTASNLKLKLSSYQDLVKQHGFEMLGPNKAVLENAYTELQLAYKEAANLGVLNGPDLGLVENAIRSATPGFLGNVGNILRLGGGTRNLEANLEQAQTTLNNSASLVAEQLYARNPAYKQSSYVQSLVLPFGDELITKAEQDEMDAALNK